MASGRLGWATAPRQADLGVCHQEGLSRRFEDGRCPEVTLVDEYRTSKSSLCCPGEENKRMYCQNCRPRGSRGFHLQKMWNDVEPRFGGSEQYSCLFQSRSARGAATGTSCTRPSMMAQVSSKILDAAGACLRYSGWGDWPSFHAGSYFMHLLYAPCRCLAFFYNS